MPPWRSRRARAEKLHRAGALAVDGRTDRAVAAYDRPEQALDGAVHELPLEPRQWGTWSLRR